jgi:hypothetical protein
MFLQVGFFFLVFVGIRSFATNALNNSRQGACLPSLIHGFVATVASFIGFDRNSILDFSHPKQELTYELQTLLALSIGYFLNDLECELRKGYFRKQWNIINILHHIGSILAYILFIRINTGYQILLLYLFIGECTNSLNILFELYRTVPNYQNKMGYKIIFTLFVIGFLLARGIFLPIVSFVIFYEGKVWQAMQYFPLEVSGLCILLIFMTIASWMWLNTMTRKLWKDILKCTNKSK